MQTTQKILSTGNNAYSTCRIDVVHANQTDDIFFNISKIFIVRWTVDGQSNLVHMASTLLAASLGRNKL